MNHGQRMFQEASRRAQESARRMQEDAARRAQESARRMQEDTARRARESMHRMQADAVRQAQENANREVRERSRRGWELYALRWQRKQTTPQNRGKRGPWGSLALFGAVFVVIATVVVIGIFGLLTGRATESPAVQQFTGHTIATEAVRIVTIDGLNLRDAPKQSKQTFIRELRKGERVTLLDDAAVVSDGITWVRVRAGDTIGWVSRKYLK